MSFVLSKAKQDVQRMENFSDPSGKLPWKQGYPNQTFPLSKQVIQSDVLVSHIET